MLIYTFSVVLNITLNFVISNEIFAVSSRFFVFFWYSKEFRKLFTFYITVLTNVPRGHSAESF
jgi:hypothetical protein